MHLYLEEHVERDVEESGQLAFILVVLDLLAFVIAFVFSFQEPRDLAVPTQAQPQADLWLYWRREIHGFRQERGSRTTIKPRGAIGDR